MEKVKITVSVRGHRWSSARLVHEKLQDFVQVVQKNALFLNHIEEGDTIQRLQLANADGSEPEDLDVDGTIEDAMICMGNVKHLVAVINFLNRTPPMSNRRLETETNTAPNGYMILSPNSSALADASTSKHICKAPLQPKPSPEAPTRGLEVPLPPSSDGVDSEHKHGHLDLAFAVHRRSKTGLGARLLTLADLQQYFHLRVPEAAKKLGVCQSTLKKACRKMNIERWPGRKVRSRSR